jgi:hypothetical protein
MIGYYDRNGDPITPQQWGVYFQDADYKILKQDTLVLGGPVEISTVWLGIDHNFSELGPPLIFETAVFGEESTLYRWATEEEALAEHEKLVEQVRLLAEAFS